MIPPDAGIRLKAPADRRSGNPGLPLDNPEFGSIFLSNSKCYTLENQKDIKNI